MFYFHNISSICKWLYYFSYEKVITPIGSSSVMTINMKMVTLSKIIGTTSVMKINMKSHTVQNVRL